MVVCKKCITFAQNFKNCAVFMEEFSSFNALIEKAIVKNWDQDALTDYQGENPYIVREQWYS